ncbi:MAG: hypothetical protein LUQ07_01595, partial [Methanospirillum sp.]|nr:hypothetical protein [Methanospirillum sp.]
VLVSVGSIGTKTAVMGIVSPDAGFSERDKLQSRYPGILTSTWWKGDAVLMTLTREGVRPSAEPSNVTSPPEGIESIETQPYSPPRPVGSAGMAGDSDGMGMGSSAGSSP